MHDPSHTPNFHSARLPLGNIQDVFAGVEMEPIDRAWTRTPKTRVAAKLPNSLQRLESQE